MQAGKSFVDKFSNAGILDDFEGSDHAPVYADLQLPEPLPRGSRAPALDLRNRRTATGADFAVLLFGILQNVWWPSQGLLFCCMAPRRRPAGAADVVVDEP